MREYDVKVSKKIRFGRSDVDRTEEFGDFEAFV
jgi:hypothetical protein